MNPIEIDAKYQKLSEAMARWCDATLCLTSTFCDWLAPSIKGMLDIFTDMLPPDFDTAYLSEFVQACEDFPRICHLAYNAKKYRVRKKNIRRLEKISQKHSK